MDFDIKYHLIDHFIYCSYFKSTEFVIVTTLFLLDFHRRLLILLQKMEKLTGLFFKVLILNYEKYFLCLITFEQFSYDF